MQLSWKKIAPWLLLSYTYLLCFIVSKLPIDDAELGVFTLDIFPRIMCGVGLFLMGGAFVFQSVYEKWFSREWLVLNVFIVVSFSIIYTFFHNSCVGLNGLVGDAYFSAAMITKYKYFHLLTDFNYAGLWTSYPALFHYVIGKIASIAGIESYTAVQLGYYLVYCVLVIPLFWLLRKSIGQTAALASVFFLFLNFPLDNIFKPYEFITAFAFLAWWLVFIEGENNFSWKKALLGGIIGGAIFATYYYWFFVAAIYLFWSFLWELKQFGFNRFIEFRRQSITVLLLAAVFSSFYWLPLFFDFVRFGVVSQQNMWMSEDMVRFNFLEQDSLLVQMVSLAGVVLVFVFRSEKVMKVLLKLLVAMALWTLLGFLSFYVGKPLIANKLHYLIFAVCAVGFFYGLFVCVEWNNLWKAQLPLAVYLLLMLLGCNNFLNLKAHPFYQSMNGYAIPPIQQNAAQIELFKNKVMLTERQHINALVPVHYFININAHFSHPASRFRERMMFLQQLQSVQSPAVIAWFLAYNKFNKVDLIYFEQMPTLTIFDDDFPHGHKQILIQLNPQLLQSEFVQPFGALPKESGIIFELKPPPFEFKSTFNSFEKELLTKYAQ